jgi:glutathione synthase
MIEDAGEANLAQMTEGVRQDGYAIVQEFVDGGEDGDAGSSCSRDRSSSATGS